MFNSFMNSPDPFEPDFKAFDLVPQSVVNVVQDTYNALGQIIANIAQEQYNSGNVVMEIMPVSPSRVVSRIYGANEDTEKPRTKSKASSSIAEFITDLESVSQSAYPVISFEAQDMINALKHLTKDTPQQDTYWGFLNDILVKYQQHSPKIGVYARPS